MVWRSLCYERNWIIRMEWMINLASFDFNLIYKLLVQFRLNHLFQLRSHNNLRWRYLTWSVATVPMHVNGSLKYEQTLRGVWRWRRCNTQHRPRVMSQSLDVLQSSAYCLATAIGARHTLAPLVADTSQINPDSQSASRRHNSPNFRPYANKQFPITEIIKWFINLSFLFLLNLAALIFVSNKDP